MLSCRVGHLVAMVMIWGAMGGGSQSWGQASSRVFSQNREVWKAVAEQDYQLAETQSKSLLENRILAGENYAEPAYQLGYCAAMTQRFHVSEFWYRVAYEEMTALPDPKSEEELEFMSALLNNLGIVTMDQEKETEAASYYRQAKELVSPELDPKAYWETSLNQAVMAGRAGDVEIAENLYNEVAVYFERTQNALGQAMLEFNRGGMYLRAGAIQKSISKLTAAERQFLALGDSARAANACMEALRLQLRGSQSSDIEATYDRFVRLTKGHLTDQFRLAIALAEGIILADEGDVSAAQARIDAIKLDDWQMEKKWRADLAYVQTMLASKRNNLPALEEVIYGFEREARSDYEMRFETQLVHAQEVKELAHQLGDLHSLRERNLDKRSIEIRNWVLFAIMVLSGAGFAWGYRQHRKGQRFLFTIISRRVREQVAQRNEELGEDTSDSGRLSKMPKHPSNELFVRIENLMQENKPFLDSNLTVSGLAQLVEANYTYTASAIQSGAGLGVSEYINQHRVNHVMELLLDPGMINYSFEHIAEISGFNSVSTLYRQFNRFAGMTPGAFRKAIADGLVS